MTAMTVPVIDLAPYLDGTDKMAVARAVDRACRSIGFLVVTGHGVSPALVERTRAAGRDFFDLPERGAWIRDAGALIPIPFGVRRRGRSSGVPARACG